MAIAGLSAALAFPAVKFPNFFRDDAFFYLKTAQNLASGLGSTFDGINRTNGFHPLYLWLLTLIARATPLTGMAGLYVGFAFDLACAAVWLIAMDVVFQRMGLATRTRRLASLWLVPIAFLPTFGTEAHLSLAAVGIFLCCISTARDWPIALAGAVVVLSRLDLVLFVVLVSAWQTPLRRTLVRLSLPVAALGAFALANKVLYGHPATISSALKFGVRPDLAHVRNDLTDLPLHVRIGWGFSVAAAIWHLAHRHRPAWLSAAAVWLLVQSMLLVFWLRSQIEPWYLVLPLSVGGLLLCAILAPAIERGRRLHAAVVGVGAVLATAVLLYPRSSERTRALELAAWMRQQLPADARLFQVDHAGTFGYFSERAIVNGDGLVNSWAYQDALRSGHLQAFLQAEGVKYVVWQDYAGESIVTIPVPLWDRAPLKIRIPASPVVARSGRYVVIGTNPMTWIVE
jgi:hypothetical protein